MPEDPNLPESSTPAEESSEFAEAEWDDDNSYIADEEFAPAPSPMTDAATDEWNVATLEWEDELIDPPDPLPRPTTTQEALAWVQPTWRRLKRLWQRLITGVRNRIPAAANLSDSVISALLVGILVVLLILLNGVRQPSVASTLPPPIETGPPTRPPAVDVAPEMEAPMGDLSPTADASIRVAEPTLVDGDRIAKIQTQMTDSSILNAQRVIDSVQADLLDNRLTLVFNSDWYRLSDYDQTQLAQALMQRSQNLAFADLKFLDAEGDLLARSPVVGREMVILQRARPPEVPVPERPRFRVMVDR